MFMLNQMKMRILSSRGSALAIVLVVMTVTFLLVTGLVMVAQNENLHVLSQTESEKAYYLARAGVEAMAKEIERLYNENPSNLQYFISGDRTATSQGDALGVPGGVIEVTVSYDNTDNEFIMDSVGTIGPYTGIARLTMAFVSGGNLDAAIKTNVIEASMKDLDGDLLFETPYDPKDLKISDGEYTLSQIDEFTLNIDEFDYAGSDLGSLSTITTAEGTNTITGSAIIAGIDKKDDIVFDTTNAEFKKVHEAGEFTIETLEAGDSALEKWMVVEIDDEVAEGDISVTGGNNLLIVVLDHFSIKGSFTIASTSQVLIVVLDHTDTPASTSTDPDLLISGSSSVLGVTDEPSYFGIIGFGADAFITMNINATVYGKFFCPEGSFYMKNGNSDLFGSIAAENVEIDAQGSIHYDAGGADGIEYGSTLEVGHWEDN